MDQGNRIPVGVVGLGHFGRFHAQKWHKTPGARLVALVDQDRARAQALADELGGDIAVLDDPRALAGLAAVASVAVPTLRHFDVASSLIDLGLHLLIEKPIAATLEEADRLITAAKAKGVRIQIGHQERYFFDRVPADRLPKAPLAMRAERFGVPSGRVMDCSVVLDLMIHDIDLCLSRIAAPLVSVKAEGGVSAETGLVEAARVRLDFADGSSALLHADRLAAERRRVMRLDDVTVDFLARRAFDGSGAEIPLAPIAAEVETDTLLAQSTAFIAALKGGPSIGADGVAGRRALEAALAIDKALGV